MPPGMSENPTGTSGANEPQITSGIADSSLISMLEAASSAASSPEATPSGDTTQQGGESTPAPETGTIAQPAENGSSAAPVQQPTGDAPENRIQAAVKNARAQARAEAMEEMRQQFAPFQGLNPEQVQTALAVLQELESNPQGFFQELQARLNAGQPQADEAYPEPDLVSKDGRIKSYGAETFQKALDIHGRRVTAQVMRELKPFVDHARKMQTKEQNDAVVNQRLETLSSALKEARETLPYFTKENEPKILAAIQALDPARRKSLGPVASLHVAYNNFFKDHIQPGLDAAAEKRVRDSFNKKANGGTGVVHPANGSGDPKVPELRGESDLAAHMARMAAAQTA